MPNLAKTNSSYDLLSKDDQKILNAYEEADLPGLGLANAVKAFNLFMRRPISKTD
jgi:hypothetical protein